MKHSRSENDKIMLGLSIFAPILVMELKKLGLDKDAERAELDFNASIKRKDVESFRVALNKWADLVSEKKRVE